MPDSRASTSARDSRGKAFLQPRPRTQKAVGILLMSGQSIAGLQDRIGNGRHELPSPKEPREKASRPPAANPVRTFLASRDAENIPTPERATLRKEIHTPRPPVSRKSKSIR